MIRLGHHHQYHRPCHYHYHYPHNHHHRHHHRHHHHHHYHPHHHHHHHHHHYHHHRNHHLSFFTTFTKLIILLQLYYNHGTIINISQANLFRSLDKSHGSISFYFHGLFPMFSYIPPDGDARTHGGRSPEVAWF